MRFSAPMEERPGHLSRRRLLAGLAAGVVLPSFPALAAAPERSLRPVLRPGDLAVRTLPAGDEIVAAAGLSGKTSFVVADARSGAVLESRSPLLQQAPASVAKAITTLYALASLGGGYRFSTRLVATGPVSNGRLEGDLLLLGGGDPTLDTDALAAMAADLKASGLREITGRFRIAEGALPGIRSIDPGQPDHVGYSPAISGLNLNYNRVYFEWKRSATGYDLTMDARSERYRPRVSVARIDLAERDLPVYTYADRDDSDIWTVARSALGNGGGRWLPVRHPGRYAGEVFLGLARAHGIELRAGDPVRGRVTGGAVLVEHVSEDLRDILRAMLRYSTNITAEAIGLTATLARGTNVASLAESGAAMSDWLGGAYGATRARFVDHSGLGEDSRISASALVGALVTSGPEGELRRLLKDNPLRDDDGDVLRDSGVEIVAKTGTLNFVSGLGGYIRTRKGRDLAFAIFSGDHDRRDTLSRDERERPPGGRAWTLRARGLQNGLLRRWALAYDA